MKYCALVLRNWDDFMVYEVIFLLGIARGHSEGVFRWGLHTHTYEYYMVVAFDAGCWLFLHEHLVHRS